ncbi:MAG: hypothetical protein HY293_12505 [Planctomycetes bacterium]|nr:hypothetical protein [Planctomycetota bacterium]
MKLSEITGEDVLAGKLWILVPGQDGETNPTLKETIGFTGEDMGLISAVVRIADGSEHLGLVVKSFPQGGDDVDIYIKTNFGWLNIHANGFMRALGKYSHEIFPFDYFLSNPWKGGKQPEPDKASSHPKIFRDTAVRIKGMPSAAKKK